MTFDPRTMSIYVYEELKNLRSLYDTALNSTENPLEFDTYESHLKEQKNQAVELYTYLSTWGLMRLRAEEIILDKWDSLDREPTIQERAAKNQEGKREVIEKYFHCLGKICGKQNLSSDQGLDALKTMNTNEYLGLTGLGLEIAQEFSFWASAIYHDITGGE